MRERLLQNKSIILIGGFVAVVLLGLLVFFMRGSSVATLIVNTVEGADIYVSRSQDGRLEKIGTTTATYKISEGGEVYVEVRGDSNRVSRSGAVLDEAETKEIYISLGDIIEAQKQFSGALLSPYISGDSVYGVDPSTYSFINFGLSDFEPPVPQYIGLGSINKIAWQDPNNFVYEDVFSGVSQFINGKKFLNGIADSFDFTIYPGKPLVILGESSLYLSENLGQTTTTIAEDFIGEQNIAADSRYIFLSSEELPQSYASEGDDTDRTNSIVKNIESTDVTVHDYKGNVIAKFSAPAENIYSIASAENGKIVVTYQEGIFIYDVKSKKSNTVPIYSDYVRDIVSIKNKVLVYLNDGLWSLDEENESLSLLYAFPAGERAMTGTLEALDTSTIIFGTTENEDVPSTSQSESTYTITFN